MPAPELKGREVRRWGPVGGVQQRSRRCGDRSAARRRALQTSSLGHLAERRLRSSTLASRMRSDASDRAGPRSRTDSQTRQRNNVRDDRGNPGWRRTACCSRGGVLGGPGWTRVEILDVPAAGPDPVLRLAAVRRPATRTVETAAGPILRRLLVGDPVGMLSCNHVEELDQTAAELRARLFKPQAQRALALDAAIPEPVLDVPGIVVTLRERLDRLVVYAVTDSATPRAEISEPQTCSMKTALLRGCHASDRGFDVVATLRVGADVPNGGVAVIRAPTRGGSTV
jgi:hypothetical protein